MEFRIDGMNYEDLRRYQRMEKGSPKLCGLNSGFYTELAGMVRQAKDQYNQSKSADSMRALENIVKVSRDLFSRREQKLVMKALYSSRTKEEAGDEVVEFEKTALSSLLKTICETRSSFESVITGDAIQSIEKDNILKEKIEEIAGNGNGNHQPIDLNMVLVKIVKSVPKFISSDLKELGPFEADQLIKLPEKEAVLLCSKSLAEKI
ncbi:MAG: hypothetical protein V1911_00105 [Candidatus Micrarchaeota archaeon]